MTTPDANADPSPPADPPAEQGPPPADSPAEQGPPPADSPAEPGPPPAESGPQPAEPGPPPADPPVEPTPKFVDPPAPEPARAEVAPDQPDGQSQEQPPRRRRWRWAVPLAVVLAAIVVLAGSYRIYGEWPWSAYPSRLHACGIGFQHHGAQTRAQIQAQGDALVPLGKVPGWLNSGKLFTTSAGNALVGQKCHARMWVQTGRDTFQLYSQPAG